MKVSGCTYFCYMIQYILGWLFERNRAIGTCRYFKNNVNHNPIVLVMLTIALVVCVILASMDLVPNLFSLFQPEMYCSSN